MLGIPIYTSPLCNGIEKVFVINDKYYVGDDIFQRMKTDPVWGGNLPVVKLEVELFPTTKDLFKIPNEPITFRCRY